MFFYTILFCTHLQQAKHGTVHRVAFLWLLNAGFYLGGEGKELLNRSEKHAS